MKTKNPTYIPSLFLGLLFFLTLNNSIAQIKTDLLKAKDLTNLSFEELMHVEIKVASQTDQIKKWPDDRAVRFEVAVDVTDFKLVDQKLRSTMLELERSYNELAKHR